MPDDETPVKRGPGRPRKVQPEPAPKPESKPAPKSDPDDPRIGETVADDRWRHISFSDGSEYRVENGVIVERL